MDRDHGLGGLPKVHALALRLERLGADVELIAECLRIDPVAVGPLLEVARAKAAADPSTRVTR